MPEACEVDILAEELLEKESVHVLGYDRLTYRSRL